MNPLNLVKLVGGVHPLLGIIGTILSATPKTAHIAEQLKAVTERGLDSDDQARIAEAGARVEVAAEDASARRLEASEESQRAYVKGFVGVKGLFAKTALFLVVFARPFGYYVFWLSWAAVPFGVFVGRIDKDSIAVLIAYIGTAIPVVLYQVNRRTREKQGGFASGYPKQP